MQEHTDDLNALLGSRICHDLISPLGAIGNGVELLAMSGVGAGPEMSLIAESVENANARIRFFRVAFGASTSDQEMGRSEIESILKSLSANGRVQMEWANTGGGGRAEVKLAFLIVLCCETAMPWGGQITIARLDDAWQINGIGDRMKEMPELWAHLTDATPPGDVIAAEVHFPLARRAAAAIGREISVIGGADRITVSF